MAEPLLITHTDMDGSCCAICFIELYPSALVLYTDYDKIEVVLQTVLDTNPKGLVVVADISGSRELMEALFARRGSERIRFFDHHKEKEYLNSFVGSRHALDKCAGLILAEELVCPPHCIDFAEVVDCYDRWITTDPNWTLARDLNRLHKFIGQKRFVERGAELLPTREEDDLIEILTERDKLEISQWKEMAHTYLDGEGTCFLFMVGVPGSVVNAVLTSHPCAKYGVVWNAPLDTLTFYSTDQGPDVQQMAKRFGGGGHRNAAGCLLKVEQLTAAVQALLSR